MKRKFSTRIIAGIATSAVLAVGSLSFTAINAIADEAVSYYGLSADGTVISGTVTDYLTRKMLMDAIKRATQQQAKILPGMPRR